MYKAVLFDLDGTLINTNDLILETFKHTYRNQLNLEVKDEDIVKYFGEPLITTLKRFNEDKAEEMLKTYLKYNEEIHDKMAKEISGVYDAVSMIKKKGILEAVVTSKRRVMAIRGLKLIKILDFMDEVVTFEDTEKKKPDGEPALHAIKLLGIKPSEAIMVGDSYFDILCGRNAGCATCLVSYSAMDTKEVIKNYKPDFVVDNLLGLLDILK